jgi:tetratricopeptide (TPR) repeat protein
LSQAISEILSKQEVVIQAAVSERYLQLRPEDQDARFKLGYFYGDNGQTSLGLHHYLKIPHEARGAWTWNNLGVSYGNISAKGKSVAAYEKAESMGNTLATSNRARLLRDSGFLRMAESACKDALLKDEPDLTALGETLSSISVMKEEDQKKEDDHIKRAEPAEEFLRKFGVALAHVDVVGWEGVWSGSDYDLSISAVGNELVGSAKYEKPHSMLRGLMMIGSHEPEKKEAVVVKLTATAFGAGSYGRIETGVVGSLVTAMGGSDSNKIFLAMHDSGQSIDVFELQGDGKFKFYKLLRQ